MKTNLLLTAVIGIDLGDLRHAVCVLDGDGNTVEEISITNTRESLTKLAKKYSGARIAMEVGSHSPWISRLLTELGCEVIVANPRKLRVIYENQRKSDKIDAQMLAKLARADVTLLHPVKHGSEQAQRDLLRIKLRDNLVRQRGSQGSVNIFQFFHDQFSPFQTELAGLIRRAHPSGARRHRSPLRSHSPGKPQRWPKRNLAQGQAPVYPCRMTVEELKTGARELPEDQRFELLADLLGSLPVVLSDVDDGSEEASRRLTEMRSDPSTRMTWDEVKSEIGR